MNNCVYKFINKYGEIIYIGKSKRLKSRINNHKHLDQIDLTENASIHLSFCRL